MVWCQFTRNCGPRSTTQVTAQPRKKAKATHQSISHYRRHAAGVHAVPGFSTSIHCPCRRTHYSFSPAIAVMQSAENGRRNDDMSGAEKGLGKFLHFAPVYFAPNTRCGSGIVRQSWCRQAL